MATTKHQTVFTPNTGGIDIYIWQKGQDASEWQVVFQYKNDARGGYWSMWLERKDQSEDTTEVAFGSLGDAVKAFLEHPEGQFFTLPDTMVAEVR